MVALGFLGEEHFGEFQIFYKAQKLQGWFVDVDLLNGRGDGVGLFAAEHLDLEDGPDRS